ncbi:MAG: hypothetical protein FJX54_18790 [Alphaproteobacteria bacterium]|nr:hypothetical protein [Alphaproteobacteria bacterium]
MTLRSLAAALLAGAFLLALSPGNGSAQTANPSPVIPVKPTVNSKPGTMSTAPAKKAPGKTCSEFTSNSQAHKDCIARQAKIEKSAKDKKTMKAEKAPKKS